MREDPSRSKQCSCFQRRFYWPPSPASCSGGASSKPSTNTEASREAASSSCAQGGFLLVFLLPLLLLLASFLAGSLDAAWRSQAKVALQSRLDVCALRMALERKSTLRKLVRGNQAISLTVAGIYAARGAKAAGPVGAVLGTASEAVLLRMNGALSAMQDTQLAIAGGKELMRLRCEPGQFSKEPATCLPEPPLLSALRREQTLFPDVKGALVHRNQGGALASFRCRSGSRSAAAVELRGGERLRNDDFKDGWTE